MINDYYVIDAHCHIYPEKIAAKAVGATDKFYDVSSDGEGTVSDLAERCKKSGIDHAVVQSVATTPKQVVSINEFIAAEVLRAQGLLTGLGTLHPDSADIKGDIEHIISLGLKGVKLHPDIQGFRVDDPRLLKVYEICEELDLPMLVHTGDRRYDNSNPDRVESVLKSFPQLTFVGAHFGGWSVWTEAAERLSEYKNFYVDCSSSFTFADGIDFKDIIMRYGTDKVLFGTDYPMWSGRVEIEKIFSFAFSEKENQDIFCNNAKKVFKIE